jgi:hypothetical protein
MNGLVFYKRCWLLRGWIACCLVGRRALEVLCWNALATSYLCWRCGLSRDLFTSSAFSYALKRLTRYWYRQGITHSKYFLLFIKLYLRTTGGIVIQVLLALALRTCTAWVLLASPTNDSSLLPKLRKLQFSSQYTYDFCPPSHPTYLKQR